MTSLRWLLVSAFSASSLLALGLALPGCGGSSGGGGGGGASGGGAGSTQGGSGAQAVAYLSSASFTSLRVEVDYVASVPPGSAALDHLRARLAERCAKPDGVVVELGDSIAPSSTNTWTLNDIQALEARFRNRTNTANEVVLYVLYLDGRSDQDDSNRQLLGLSYSASSFCVFQETVLANSSRLGRGAVERAVLVHEAGHNLGLVNNGIVMQTPHQDVANGPHDVDADCVMHHAIESSRVAQILGAVPDDFCANCIADMRAAGGR